MFLSNKNLLGATVHKQVLEVESQMIALYSTNLSSIGTQSALLAGLAFTALNNVYQQNVIKSDWLAYGYNGSYTICLISALMVMSHTVIASMFGPKRALTGIMFLLLCKF